MIRFFKSFSKTVPLGLCFALSRVVLVAQQPQPVMAPKPHSNSLQERVTYPQEYGTEIPSQVDAPLVANTLVSAFEDRSSLERVPLLEKLDASPAIDEPVALSLLHDALHDEDPLVREASLLALTRRDSPEHPVLTEADVIPFQGENAELARIHFAANHEDTATLRVLMQSGDALVQETAFVALATKDLTAAVEALRAELENTKSPYRLQTLGLFTRSPYINSYDQLLPVLRKAAEDQDPLVRDYARALLSDTE